MTKRKGLPRQTQHETDTQAGRSVQMALPSSWVSRDLTGQDYGIDLAVELFKAGAATGAYLFFQLKGTATSLSLKGGVSFPRFPVKTLSYAELFEVPVVLAFCPVTAGKPKFSFLWLQEYIRVELNYSKPRWRSQKHVTLKLPPENRMPTKAGRLRLRWIAGHPRRLNDLGRLGGIQHDLRLRAVTLNPSAPDQRQVREMRELIEHASDLTGLFGKPVLPFPAAILEDAIQPGLAACDLLLRGGPFTTAEIDNLMWDKVPTPRVPGNGSKPLAQRLVWVSHQLSAVLGVQADPDVARAIWLQNGFHLF